MGLSREEQETIIIWNERDPEVKIYTASSRVAYRLRKIGLTPLKQEGPEMYFVVPKAAIRVKTGTRAVRVAAGLPCRKKPVLPKPNR